MEETYLVTEKYGKDCGCRCAGNIFHCMECNETGKIHERTEELTKKQLYATINQTPCYITKVELKNN